LEKTWRNEDRRRKITDQVTDFTGAP
jgi:hypothetical protein